MTERSEERKLYRVGGKSYSIQELARISGRDTKSIRRDWKEGKSVIQSILPKKCIFMDGKRKYVDRDPKELIEFNGEKKTMLEWGLQYDVPLNRLLNYMSTRASEMQRAKAFRERMEREKEYLVKYYVYYRDHVDVRIERVRKCSLDSFLRTHIFSKVLREVTQD